MTNLPGAVDGLLADAAGTRARRAARSVVGGAHALLRQTLMALCAGTSLDEHDAPAAATLLVLRGRVRLVAGTDAVELADGDLATVPPRRHHLDAVEDAVVLLTVTHGSGPDPKQEGAPS